MTIKKKPTKKQLEKFLDGTDTTARKAQLLAELFKDLASILNDVHKLAKGKKKCLSK